MASANGSKAKETQESDCSERTIDHLSLLKSIWILTCTHQNDYKICLTCDRTHTRSSIREITWKRAFFDVTIEEHYHTRNNGNHFLTIFYQQTRQTRIKIQGIPPLSMQETKSKSYEMIEVHVFVDEINLPPKELSYTFLLCYMYF